MKQSCNECSRLQQERNEANNELLRMISKMQRAVLLHDAAALSRAKASLDEAIDHCEAVRLAYEEHSRTHE
jgi:hypothetical protein